MALPPAAQDTDRAILERLYRAAVRAVDPGPAVDAALQADAAASAARGHRLWIVALGKASVPMARAAAAAARRANLDLAGGIIVSATSEPSPDAALQLVTGDHPEPGARSQAASDQLGGIASRVQPGDHAWVLLSGGATALIGAPLPGIPGDDLRQLYRLLLGSGLDITAMNLIRKRFTHWGGGKLALALQGAHIRQYVVSDVIGDDLPSIGSGPCVADDSSAKGIRDLLESSGLWASIPPTLQGALNDMRAGRREETPKPGDAAVASVRTRVISSNRLALEGAAAEAAGLGLTPEIVHAPLQGEASTAGTSVAATLRNYSQSRSTQGSARPCVIWGGETTVTLGPGSGLGGRSQELALAASRALEEAVGVSLLAAGTDGRDGPTDAAGAFVDEHTWQRIRSAQRDPARDLASHDAYPALDAAGALFRPGATGTNVMDVVIGLV